MNDKDNFIIDDFINECENSEKFNYLQIEEIRVGFKNGLTIEQIKFYAKPEFNWEQMNIIRQDFENGLSIEEIKLYANPKFTVEQMIKLRKLIL